MITKTEALELVLKDVIEFFDTLDFRRFIKSEQKVLKRIQRDFDEALSYPDQSSINWKPIDDNAKLGQTVLLCSLGTLGEPYVVDKNGFAETMSDYWEVSTAGEGKWFWWSDLHDIQPTHYAEIDNPLEVVK